MAAERQLREMEALPTKGEQNVRKSQWGRGTEVLRRLDQMIVSEDTGTADGQLNCTGVSSYCFLPSGTVLVCFFLLFLDLRNSMVCCFL